MKSCGERSEERIARQGHSGEYDARADSALKWLNRAYDNREPQFGEIKGEPNLRNLRGDLRFAALLRKLKLPE